MKDQLTEKIIGSAIEVHRILGPGLLESVYEEALCHELTLQNMRFERQVAVDVLYKGHVIHGQRLVVSQPKFTGFVRINAPFDEAQGERYKPFVVSLSNHQRRTCINPVDDQNQVD